ncbi:hypothetical protein EYF80_011878 [Liparis tanakae]|uniref:Uncharacterized protein n=1 Tax=Liparis tanakae TaxID=230148 RepID=A0A4Z2IJ79_9TELE|nr:hypothetical protein EYF80_011878 [Liparis tanakae]
MLTEGRQLLTGDVTPSNRGSSHRWHTSSVTLGGFSDTSLKLEVSRQVQDQCLQEGSGGGLSYEPPSGLKNAT